MTYDDGDGELIAQNRAKMEPLREAFAKNNVRDATQCKAMAERLPAIIHQMLQEEIPLVIVRRRYHDFADSCKKFNVTIEYAFPQLKQGVAAAR